MSTQNSRNPWPDCERCQSCDPGYRDGRCIEDWKLTREAIHHENELINQRLNWLPLAQGLYCAVFAFFAQNARPVFANLVELLGLPFSQRLNPEGRPVDLGVLLGLIPEKRPVDLGVLLGLIGVALIALSYSFIVYVTIQAAVKHISHLEEWWNLRYNEPEERQQNNSEKIKRRKFLPYPPINGLFEEGLYMWTNARLVPLTFAFVWALILVGLLIVMIAQFPGLPFLRNPFLNLILILRWILLIIVFVFFFVIVRRRPEHRQSNGSESFIPKSLMMRCRTRDDSQKRARSQKQKLCDLERPGPQEGRPPGQM
jgi:hypothetical protein